MIWKKIYNFNIFYIKKKSLFISNNKWNLIKIQKNILSNDWKGRRKFSVDFTNKIEELFNEGNQLLKKGSFTQAETVLKTSLGLLKQYSRKFLFHLLKIIYL